MTKVKERQHRRKQTDCKVKERSIDLSYTVSCAACGIKSRENMQAGGERKRERLGDGAHPRFSNVRLWFCVLGGATKTQKYKHTTKNEN